VLSGLFRVTDDKASKAQDERPPLGSWRRVYAVVIGNLVLCILLLLLFTKVFGG
jgi:hypothetical protein